MLKAAKSDNYTIVSDYLEYRRTGLKALVDFVVLSGGGELGYTKIVS